ncbi:MAG: HlyC/CorC family transporter [Bacteroidales bacterium]|nr:HlyC/CorC family transporter [Bacteroidales bacterium]
MSHLALLLIFLLGAMSISFLCSILEAVLMSTPLSYITMREDAGYKPATRFKQYKTDNGKPIAAILSLNTIANTIGAAGVGAQASSFGGNWFGIISALTTILILIFSEIIPKTIGTTYWRKLMGFTARTIRLLIVLMFPFVWLIGFLTKLISKEDDEATVSREEVAAMADVGEDEGVLDEDENKIIQNVIKLDDIKAYDVMTPHSVAAVAPEAMTLRDFYKVEEYSHFSRIPVYADDPEYITGYILRSDALEDLAEDHFDKTLGQIKRAIPLFNEEQSVSEIWDSLLKHKEQIAIIIDEYGGFQGILTLEDIIETIFGLEIIDENDEVTDMQQYARERWQQRQRRFKSIRLPEENPDDKA